MKTALLLFISNIFMTLAWYGHLKFKDQPLWLVVVVSWFLFFLNIFFRCRPIVSAQLISLSRSSKSCRNALRSSFSRSLSGSCSARCRAGITLSRFCSSSRRFISPSILRNESRTKQTHFAWARCGQLSHGRCPHGRRPVSRNLSHHLAALQS